MRKLEHILSPFIFLAIWQIAEWLTHEVMTKNSRCVKKLKLASYKDVKQKMISTHWEFDPKHPKSLFTENDDAYFHAGIIRFEDVGYLLTPFGLLYAKNLQKKIRRNLKGFELYKKKPYIK